MKNDLLTEPLLHVAVPFGQDHEDGGELNETAMNPLIIMLDAVAEKERRDREARRITKKMLLNLCIVLGFVLGILCNLAGFGGENLFILLGLKEGIPMHNKRIMVLTVTFWSAFTIITLLTARQIVLRILRKALEASHLQNPKHERGSAPSMTTFAERDVAASLDYIDDKFLQAILLGTSFIGILTNIYLKLYLIAAGEVAGLFFVFLVNRCLLKKRKKVFYEQPELV